MDTWFSINQSTTTLSLYVQPGAKKTTISGLQGNALKIRLSSQAYENKANEALLRFLSQFFEVPLSSIKIMKGEKSRYKQIEIHGSLIHPVCLLKKSPF